tara:strand:+ start:178 stop:615 length:438 start_codon:yes stop_codon:yes gene_type:complete
MVGTPFKMKGFSGFGNSPLKQDTGKGKFKKEKGTLKKSKTIEMPDALTPKSKAVEMPTPDWEDPRERAVEMPTPDWKDPRERTVSPKGDPYEYKYHQVSTPVPGEPSMEYPMIKYGYSTRKKGSKKWTQTEGKTSKAISKLFKSD